RLSSTSLTLVRQILTIGVPSSLQDLAWLTGTLGIFMILSLSQHPAEALASWAIGYRLEAFVFLPLTAFGLAVASIVGRYFGANQVRHAVQLGWTVSGVGVAAMAVSGSILFMSAEPLAKLASNNPRVVEFAADFLRLNAISHPFRALEIILNGALQGFG